MLHNRQLDKISDSELQIFSNKWKQTGNIPKEESRLIFKSRRRVTFLKTKYKGFMHGLNLNKKKELSVMNLKENKLQEVTIELCHLVYHMWGICRFCLKTKRE